MTSEVGRSRVSVMVGLLETTLEHARSSPCGIFFCRLGRDVDIRSLCSSWVWAVPLMERWGGGVFCDELYHFFIVSLKLLNKLGLRLIVLKARLASINGSIDLLQLWNVVVRVYRETSYPSSTLRDRTGANALCSSPRNQCFSVLQQIGLAS